MPRLPNSHYLEMKKIQIKTKNNEEQGTHRSMTPVKNTNDKIITILQSTGKQRDLAFDERDGYNSNDK